MPSNTNEISKLLEQLLRILKEENALDPSVGQVVEFRHPKVLQKCMSLSLGDEPASNEELERELRKIIQYSVRTTSQNFHNQLYGGIDKYGLVGAWLTEALNTSQYTYEVAPVFTLIEQEVISKTLELIGYPQQPQADGIMCPGGSIANMYGMVLARYDKMREVKKKGLFGLQPMVCFTSECGHYSIMKGAHWLGLGTDHVYQVKTDELGRMDPKNLKKSIQKAKDRGQIPFFVNATCGTTVLGAIDPLSDLVEICDSEQIWLHVDACLGGSLLLSKKYRDRLQCIERADSVTWNSHKMLGVPLQCSLFLTRRGNILYEANHAGAPYLFQKDKFYDINYDIGDKSVQCGRKVDALKFWMMWKARGTSGLQSSVDRAMYCAEYFCKQIQRTAGFRLVLPSYECCNICFWYIPLKLRGQLETEDWWKKIYTVTTIIKKSMVIEGSLMVGYSSLMSKNYGNFFRMVVTCQPPPTRKSMRHVINQIEKFGKYADLVSSL